MTSSNDSLLNKCLSVIKPEKNMEVTAVCEIMFREPGNGKPKSVGQGCLVHMNRKQCYECCIVTTEKIIQSQGDQLDDFEVQFTKKYSKKKIFCLKDIKKEVRCHSGLAIIVINLDSPKLKHNNKPYSIFTRSPMTITALDRSKQQFCYISANRYNGCLQGSTNTTIKFPDAPSTIPEGLVILQSTSNSTDNSVAVGIQSQLDDGQMTIWIHEILETGQTPGNANQQSLAGTVVVDGAGVGYGAGAGDGDGDGGVAGAGGGAGAGAGDGDGVAGAGAAAGADASVAGAGAGVAGAGAGAGAGADAGAATEPPNNELQNTVTDSETAVPGLGGSADSQSSLPGNVGDGSSPEHASLTGQPIQEEQHTTTDGATGQQIETATENYEDYKVWKKINAEKTLQYKLAVRLNTTSHSVIKNWEHLACTEVIKAPLEVRRKCKINSANRCTMTLFEKVAVEQCDKTVKNLIDALTAINRPDVKDVITDAYPDAANSIEKFSLFVGNKDNRDLLAEIASYLDKESRVNKNWFDLGLQFGLSSEELNDIKFVPCMQVIMDHLYTNKPDLTVGTFYDVVKELKRGEVLKILDGVIQEKGDRNTSMKDAITLESETMRDICMHLNNPNRALKNWKHLAKSPELGIPEDVINGCTPESPKGPMETLLEWIFVERLDLTIGQLCQALKSIDRNDVVEEIRKYFQPATTPAQ